VAGTFYASYLAAGLEASALYPVGFGTRDERVRRTRAAAQRALAPGLYERLRADNAPLSPGPAAQRHLDALGQPNVAVVVTGQQVGLCLGPLYSIFKAATAIAVARRLEAESAVRCVPLFWLQTEDQDFDEIAACTVPRPDGELVTLRLDDDPALARVPVAERRIGPGLSSQLDALAEVLENLPHAAETMALLRASYRPGLSPARAFAGVLTAIFADDGLVVLDPRNPVVAAQAVPLMRAAIADQARLDALLSERAAALAAAGFDEQVRTRPGSPLCFYHPAGARGPRHRLTHCSGGFAVDGSGEVVTREDLLATLERDPLCFSSSALLRPLVQDTILPTAAYVGGPAEVSYFAQLAPLYAHFGMTPPMQAPRARFRLLPPHVRTLLQTLGLRAAEVESEREPLLARLAAPGKARDPHAPSAAWLAELEAHLDDFAASSDFTPALRKPLERTRAAIHKNFGHLVRAHRHQLVTRDATLAGRVDRLRRWIFPGGVPQERVHAAPYYMALAGPAALGRAIVAAVDPLQPQTRDLPL
jgi:bacillithiol biosynthesis cysteine-adding enzyme BshC